MGTDALIVWFDAHGDVQTLKTTESGYVGGMPLRIAVGYRPELIADRLGLRPLPGGRALLVDARDLEQSEAEYLATAEIDADRPVRGGQLSEAILRDGPLVLHLDLDVINAADLPGMSFPVAGGPSYSAVLDAVRRILATGRVRAFDIACTWHPGEDNGEARSRVLADLLAVATLRASRAARTASISSGATGGAPPSPVILENDRRTSRSRKCHTAMPRRVAPRPARGGAMSRVVRFGRHHPATTSSRGTRPLSTPK
ncbi:arginase family protein [Saccharopolyspora spinosa]|uniref:arginase family protein n=1 Tax=Saccharopolyspora spinosa TaxID=60894 RepID=UPI0002379628|nr:arginase family protein [Saccharopolyspora spinosa]